MRRMMVLGALTSAGMGAAAACGPSSSEMCEFNFSCAWNDGGVDATVDAGAGEDGGDGGGDAGDGGVWIPPDGGPCGADAGAWDNPRLTGCKPGDDTGLFVNAAGESVDAGATGTRAKPFRWIHEAIAALKTWKGPARIYICGGEYPETVTLDETLGKAVQIYGQMSCSSWSWSWQSADRVHVKPSTGYALWVKGTTQGVTIEDVYFEAPAASGYEDNGAGKSSVAGFVTGATKDVVVNRGEFKANAGVEGQAGESPGDWDAAAPIGNPGTGDAGGPAQPLDLYQCANGQTQGGAGGAPRNNAGNGMPTDLPNHPYPATATGVGSSFDDCKMGIGGRDGTYGPGGATSADAGAGATGPGTLSGAGWVPQNGLSGGIGTAAQGGGGGGGNVSGGGGGGGQGGCGGGGGGGGTGGGGSIGLLVYKSPVKLAGCTVQTAGGAKGGTGGKGQRGQEGGLRGVGGGNGCNGGSGGIGGSGGGGGGGAGGVSIGIGYVGMAPVVVGVDGGAPLPEWFRGGAAGVKGAPGLKGDKGGSDGLQGGDGTSGVDGATGAVVALPGT